MKTSIYALILSGSVSMFLGDLALAEDCTQVCDANGCTTECSSQAPAPTPPDELAPVQVGNTCAQAHNGVCDDQSYSPMNSGNCPIGTDQSDCN